MDITIRLIDGQETPCPARLSGALLLALLGQSSLTLVSEQLLNNGGVYRCFRFVRPNDDLIDLTDYSELHTSNRQTFGFISTLVQAA